jgi:hypothetical protein
MTNPSHPSAAHDLGSTGHETPGVGRESTDVQIRGVLLFGLALLVTAIAIHFLVWLLFGYFSGREAARVPPEYPLALGRDAQLPPEPRLQTNPREDLRLLRAHEDEILHSYSWVDRPAGIVRIPIEEAIKLTIQRGLPARAGADKGK